MEEERSKSERRDHTLNLREFPYLCVAFPISREVKRGSKEEKREGDGECGGVWSPHS